MNGHAEDHRAPAHGGHAHGGRGTNRRRLAITLVLVTAYMIAEFVGGLLTNSLALLADAGHMLSDAGALGLALFAMWIAERPPTSTYSYGYYRTEILAALANGATLVAISILIFVEAWKRFQEPAVVQGAPMMGIAAGGLVINLVSLWILNAGRGESLNMRGAWLHVLTDALGSVGAMLGGFLIVAFGWAWADPAVSVLIAVLVVYSSWNLLRESVEVLMESAPSGLDVDAVRDAIVGVSGVTAVHDLHVWSITSGMGSLSAHVRIADGQRGNAVLADLRHCLRERFGIEHITIQIEQHNFEEPTTHA